MGVVYGSVVAFLLFLLLFLLSGGIVWVFVLIG